MEDAHNLRSKLDQEMLISDQVDIHINGTKSSEANNQSQKSSEQLVDHENQR